MCIFKESTLSHKSGMATGVVVALSVGLSVAFLVTAAIIVELVKRGSQELER